MKKGRKLGLISGGLLMAVIMCFMSFALMGCQKSDTIAVLAKGESHAFWQSVKKGADAAGLKYGYRITFQGPKNESGESIPQQKEQISTALSFKPAGIAIATIGTGYVDLLKQAYAEKIPVVQFDSGIWALDIEALDKDKKNPIVSSVATSNELAAATAAENFYAAIKADMGTAKYIVGIIQHDTSATGKDRTKGFKDKFTALATADSKNFEIKVEIKDGDANNAYGVALDALCTAPADAAKAKAIFMTNEGVVKQVYDKVSGSAAYDTVKFCGYDAGTKQIEWMKKATGAKLVGAVAQDSFQIGYQAVEQAVKAIKKETITEKVAIKGSWWDGSNVDSMIESGIVYLG